VTSDLPAALHPDPSFFCTYFHLLPCHLILMHQLQSLGCPHFPPTRLPA
jgi:hypothetical protein